MATTFSTSHPTTIHVSQYGDFRGSIPHDLDGYAHTTPEGWIGARMDISAEDRADAEYMQEWARGMAAQTISAIAEADDKLAAWRAGQ